MVLFSPQHADGTILTFKVLFRFGSENSLCVFYFSPFSHNKRVIIDAIKVVSVGTYTFPEFFSQQSKYENVIECPHF